MPPFSFEPKECPAEEREILELARKRVTVRRLAWASGGLALSRLRSTYALWSAGVLQDADAQNPPQPVTQMETGTFLLSMLQRQKDPSAQEAIRQEVQGELDRSAKLDKETWLKVARQAPREELDEGARREDGALPRPARGGVGRRPDQDRHRGDPGPRVGDAAPREAAAGASSGRPPRRRRSRRPKLPPAPPRRLGRAPVPEAKPAAPPRAGAPPLGAPPLKAPPAAPRRWRAGGRRSRPSQGRRFGPGPGPARGPFGRDPVPITRAPLVLEPEQELELPVEELAVEPVESAPAEAAPAPAHDAGARPQASLDEFAAGPGASNFEGRAKIEHLLMEGEVRMTVSDYANAIKVYEKLVEAAPKVPAYRMRLAVAMACYPRTAKHAEREFVEAMRLDPDNADHHYQFGLYFKAMKVKSRAVAEMRTAVRLSPRHKAAREELEALSPRDSVLTSLRNLFK